LTYADEFLVSGSTPRPVLAALTYPPEQRQVLVAVTVRVVAVNEAMSDSSSN
jgi:hypothetical protein